MLQRGTGYIPDEPDPRDWPASRLLSRLSAAGSPPAECDLTHLTSVGDQGATGTCVSWAGGQAVTMRQQIQGLPPERPNVLSAYWDYRPSKISDDGMRPGQYYRGMRELGWPLESEWPFANASVYDAPPPRLRASAFDRRGWIEYYRLEQWGTGLRVSQLREALAHGYPVTLAIPVDNAFRRYTGGVWTFQGDPGAVAWHYLTTCRYTVSAVGFVNSWGTGWGEGGYGWLSWEMVEDPYRVRDAYAITLVGAP